MCCGVPISFSTSTAARRAYSFSSLQHLDRGTCIVSGWLARTTASMALFCDFDVGIAQQLRRSGPTSTWPSMRRQRVQRRLAHQLVRVLELRLQRRARPRAG